MTEIKMVKLADIDMISNYRDTEPVRPTDPDVLELMASIMKMGLLQAVLLRPHPTRAARYELIFGHRRYVAAGVAGLLEIPANIKEIADGDILEIQVTENLQRKDVHALDEAIAFRSLIKDKAYSAGDIAARFGKKLEFVVQRLKLADLIAELQKPFKHNALSVGQAFVLCRLRPEDQKTFRKEWKDEEFESSSIHDIQDWINRNLLRQLSSASFKRDDATLTKAGPCTTCTKRSGCGNLLFNDLKEDDRCFDAACFQSKQDAFFLQQLQKTIETKPEVHLVADDHGKLPKEVKDLLRQMNVKLLDSGKYQRYGGYGKYRKQAKALFLDGYHRGKTDTIYLEGAEKATVKNKDGKTVVKRTVADIDTEISGIKERQKRSLELDHNKVHIAIRDQLQAKKEIKKPGLAHQGAMDRGIMVFLLLEKAAGYGASSDIEKNLKSLPKKGARDKTSYPLDHFEQLAKVTDDDIAYICRMICFHHWGNSNLQYGVDQGDTTLRIIAGYAGIPIQAIKKAQDEESAKRITRAGKRLDALRAEKKLVEETKAAKAEKKTPAKKSAKGGTKKPVASRKNHLGQELTNYGLTGPSLSELAAKDPE